MSTNKIIFIVIAVAVFCLLGILVALRLEAGPEDTWICDNGQWVEHGHPDAPMPTSSCSGAAGGEAMVIDETMPVFIAIKTGDMSIDAAGQTLSGQGMDMNQTFTVRVSSSTEIYREANEKEVMSWEEFAGMIKNWEGPSWPINILGWLQGDDVIEATEIYYTIQ